MRAIILAGCVALLLAGPARADFAAGKAAFDQGDFATAEREWRPLAEAGDAEAQYRLGNVLQAQRAAQDTEEFMDLFGATSQNEPAPGEPGLAEEEWSDPFAEPAAGGVPAPLTRTETEAQHEEAKWFRRAAVQGHPLAQFELHNVVLYQERDRVEALMWLLLANRNERAWRVVKSYHFDIAMEDMTPDEITEAKRRAEEWKPRLSTAQAKTVDAPTVAPGGPAPTEPGTLTPWWTPTAAQRAYANETGLPLARVNGLGQRLVLVPPDTFMMGSPKGEAGRGDVKLGYLDEWAHEVELTQGIYMAATEVTNAEYGRLIKDRSGLWKARGLDADMDNITYRGQYLSGDQQPVIWVNHMDALTYCTMLTEAEEQAGRLPAGWVYRLPTEAEWEYACRAGSPGRFWWGESEADAGRYANVADESARPLNFSWASFPTTDGHAGSAPVANYEPNAFGLYDMIGNVWEWCADRFGDGWRRQRRDPRGSRWGLSHIYRGGSWVSGPNDSRCAKRYSADLELPDYTRGFRVVLAPAGLYVR